MVKDPVVAKQISDTMQDMFARLSECSAMVEAQCSPDEYKEFVHSIRNISWGLVFDVMEPLYAKHPELAPSNWEHKNP